MGTKEITRGQFPDIFVQMLEFLHAYVHAYSNICACTVSIEITYRAHALQNFLLVRAILTLS